MVEVRDYGVYKLEEPDHFLFQKPEPVGLRKGETFGHAPDGGVPRAVGHEWDIRISRLVALTPDPMPAGAAWPGELPGIVTLAQGILEKDAAEFDLSVRATRSPDRVVAEMIYWERPQGGRVFHAGAIGAGWALGVDPALQKLMRNVLFHFGVPRPSDKK